MEKKELPEPLYVTTSMASKLIFGDNNQSNRAKVKRLVQSGYLMINDPNDLTLEKSKKFHPWVIKESINQYIMAAKNGTLTAHKKELAKKINN